MKNNFFNRKLFKFFAKRELKKMSDIKLLDTYKQFVNCRNKSLYTSSRPKWKVDICIDILKKEVKKRDLL